MKKILLGIAVCLTAWTAVALRPNIVLILCDDLGCGDLGVTGHPYVKTPNIDRLAAGGIRLTEAYMSGAWCGPSRAALISGRYPARNYNSDRTLEPTEPSLARALKAAGYTTAHYGKWHLGPKVGGAPPAEFGFDDARIYNGTGPTWPKEQMKAPHWREHSTSAIVDEGIAFMEKAGDQPFFINLWVYPTHSYIDPTPEMLEVYQDLKVDIDDFENPLQREFLEFVAEHGDIQDAMRAYCADVTEMDTQVGRFFQALEKLGHTENTIIIFSSDNGAAPPCNNWDSIVERYRERPTLLNCVGSSGPLRDRKISLNEGGTRVPFIVRWPAKIKPGRINSKTVFCGVDVFPTLGKLVGADVPEGLDGRDLSAAWFGREIERPGPAFWNDRPGWSTLREGKWKAHLQKKKARLYDLTNDPSESKDLSGEYPEITDRYVKMLKQWEATLPKGKK